MYGKACIAGPGWYFSRRTNDYDGIYCLLAPVLGHDDAEDAASWCELAAIGEVWVSGDGWVEIELVD